MTRCITKDCSSAPSEEILGDDVPGTSRADRHAPNLLNMSNETALSRLLQSIIPNPTPDDPLHVCLVEELGCLQRAPRMAPLVLQSSSSLFATIDATSFPAVRDHAVINAPPHHPRLERCKLLQRMDAEVFRETVLLGVQDVFTLLAVRCG